MPANRQTVQSELKASEILAVAEALFLKQGFEATSVAHVARAAGVTGNTVYWYFPSKDHLLAAILERLLDRVAAAAPEHLSLTERAMAALAKMDEFAPLTATVHERARQSEAVAEAHAQFHSKADKLVRAAFEGAGVSQSNAGMAAQAIVSMIEGIHLHGEQRDSAARDRLVRWVLARFIG